MADLQVRRIVTKAPNVEAVRVTLLNGSQLEISGPESFGLANLQPVLNAQLDDPSADTLLAIGYLSVVGWVRLGLS